jgi:hypothetical protein
MLQELYRARLELPHLLVNHDGWKSLYVDYHPPYVKRLWREWEGCRLLLHEIDPCPPGKDPLMHPHPSPSAMWVHGHYRMDVGYGTSKEAPPVAATIILAPDTAYEMIHPDGWHSVNPIGAPSLSVMVTGRPWDRWSPKSDKPLGPLSGQVYDRLFGEFRKLYL